MMVAMGSRSHSQTLHLWANGDYVGRWTVKVPAHQACTTPPAAPYAAANSSNRIYRCGG